VKVSALGFCET